MVAGTATTTTTTTPFGIKATSVRVVGYRMLEEVEVALAAGTTILLGENNSGKTTLLSALAAAFGRIRVEVEDFHRSPTRTLGELHVDVRFAPRTGDNFSEAAQNILADAIEISDVTGTPDTFGLRFHAKLEGAEIKTRRAFLDGWGATAEEKDSPSVSIDALRLIGFDMLDAQRDMVAQLRNRRTTWNDVASLSDVSPTDRDALQEELKKLSNKVTDKSAMLSRVRTDLADLGAALASGPLTVDIDTVPRNLADLTRAMDITVGVDGALPFGAAAQGMGTRSLAALLVFRSGVNGAPLPTGVDHASSARISAFEEPEAHLHPQAQRSVFATIDAVGGQKLITTHSTHLISTSPTTSFRLLRRVGASTHVSSSADYPVADIKDVERLFVHRHPEALFAKAVALFEGDSEYAFFRLLAEAWWEARADAIGITLVSCDGVGNVVFFGPLLERLGIPWIFLRDGDDAGVHAQNGLQDRVRAVMHCKEGDPDPHLRTIALPGVIEDVFESLGAGPCDGVLAGHPSWNLDDYIAHFDGQPKKKDQLRDYKGDEGRIRARRDLLKHDKLATARLFGRHIAGLPPAQWPAPFRELFVQLDQLVGRPPKEIA